MAAWGLIVLTFLVPHDMIALLSQAKRTLKSIIGDKVNNKTWRFLSILALLLTVLFILVLQLPQASAVLKTVWGLILVIVNLVVFLSLVSILFSGPFSLGNLGKHLVVRAIDPEAGFSQRATIGTVSALIVGVAWILLMYLIVAPWNWIYDFAKLPGIGWDGWENPPVGWGIFAFLAFIISWGATEHRTQEQMGRGDGAARRKREG